MARRSASSSGGMSARKYTLIEEEALGDEPLLFGRQARLLEPFNSLERVWC
jgi:hypothetical protein